jgi:protein tyrosine phosphatase (PTP) superfamily phosphohydrolase (DUF442 family)
MSSKMNNSALSYTEWLRQVEIEVGRPLTSSSGKLQLGEIGMASKMYPAGLTVEGMVALINDDGREMLTHCKIGGRAPIDFQGPRM